MGNVQRRAPGKYLGRYRGPDGRERSKQFTRKSDAEKWLADQATKLARGEWVDPRAGQLTVGEWAEHWQATRTLRTTTTARLDSTLRCQVLPKWQHRRLATIRHSEVAAWRAEMLAVLSPASARKAMIAFRSMMVEAVADRRIAVDPSQGIPLPVEHSKDHRFLTRQQVVDLVSVMPDEYKALVWIGCYAGLRFGELAALRRRDVDTLKGIIRVERSAVDVGGGVQFEDPKTRRSKRTVPVVTAVMRAIEEHLATYVDADADALVFTSSTGLPLRRGTLRRTWAVATKAADLDGVRVHDMRHSFAALMVDAGANVAQVSSWLGHSSPGFTLTRYGGLFEHHEASVIAKLDEMFADMPTPSAPVVQLRQEGA